MEDYLITVGKDSAVKRMTEDQAADKDHLEIKANTLITILNVLFDAAKKAMATPKDENDVTNINIIVVNLRPKLKLQEK